jgi:gamma-D-glutamyl-L-lysine dipeptidyl-peptidase
MSYAVCCVPIAPLRMEPDHKAEMVSQLLFGEYCTIIDTGSNGWVHIVCKADTYSGWCQLAQVQKISDVVYNNPDQVLAAGWINELDYNEQVMMVPFGSSLTAIKNGKIVWNKNEIEFNGELWKPAKIKRDAATIQQIAFTFLNTAYLWGGRSVFGIDCSGFAQMVFKFLNYPLLRDAQHQATQGETVIFLQQARCGDLAFFDDEAGDIVHVGILLNEHEIIHASGKVRIDKIDNQGIVNVDTGERTHKLRIIKRYF